MQLLIALFAGALFGAGLTVAQMVNPQKVLNFLDVAAIPAGKWDPTLIFVFAGALPVMFIAYRLQKIMTKPAYNVDFKIPVRTSIDASLVAGAAIFGVGWGLGGICPGPSIAVLPLVTSGLANLLVFLAAMIAGIGVAVLLRSPKPIIKL